MSAAKAGPLRIAVGQISQESNSFAAARTGIELFKNSYLLVGDEIAGLRDTETEVAGMLDVCAAMGAEVAPLLATRSVSGGPLTAACWAELRTGMLDRLKDALPVDGLLLSMHGSMLADGEDDPEGDLLAAARSLLGPDAPIVCTLDLHANVTPRMVRAATALTLYQHYPHDDVRETGARGARLMFRALAGTKLTMALAKTPMLAPGCEGQTFGDGPMVHLQRRARELENEPGIVSVSCCHVHAHLDVPGMGCGAVAITADDSELAARAARELAFAFWTRRRAFVPEIVSVEAAVTRGRAIAGGPVLLVDASDCTGGGAAGDSVAVLGELLRLGVNETAYVMVVDPAAASVCAAAGVGARIALDLGHSVDPTWGRPLRVEGRVRTISDGGFRYEGGLFGGTDASMGLSARLEIGAIQVLVMSKPTYDWADEQFRAVGLNPRHAKFIAVKNPMNYRFAYREIAKAAFVVDTPGPTAAQLLNLPYEEISRPMFPFDDDIPSFGIERIQAFGPN